MHETALRIWQTSYWFNRILFSAMTWKLNGGISNEKLYWNDFAPISLRWWLCSLLYFEIVIWMQGHSSLILFSDIDSTDDWIIHPQKNTSKKLTKISTCFWHLYFFKLFNMKSSLRSVVDCCNCRNWPIKIQWLSYFFSLTNNKTELNVR